MHDISKPPGEDGGDAESIEEDVLNIFRLKYLDNIASFRQIRAVKKKTVYSQQIRQMEKVKFTQYNLSNFVTL